MAFDPGAFDPGSYWGGSEPPPVGPSVVVITVDGVDVTNYVLFASANFISKVNGEPGEAFMRVRGLGHSFAIGNDWLVEINGDAAWRGFVLQVSDTYMFDAQDVDNPSFQQVTDLHGADLNILFQRRIVRKDGDLTTIEGTQFDPGTPDTDAIDELLANWLDLSTDDLDTTSAVDNVGDLDPAQKTRAWSASWTWGQAMQTIAMLPAAIFYIRPENSGGVKGTFVYCDVDVPDAPFGLSDQPDGTTFRGYREMEITEDGTSLATDVMGWGMGYGSQTPVFKREQDNVDLYGTWQTSRVVYGVYKQATIDRIVDSIIDGSPSSKRGSKNPKPSVRLVTYQPGLLAGHKLEFRSEVWDWTDVIPVRELTLTFEAPEYPKYELLLSHEIDAPWSYIDKFWPALPGLPQWPCPNPPCFVWPPPPPPPPPPCEDPEVFDDFERVEPSGWVFASSGYDWDTTSVSPGTGSATGSYVDLGLGVLAAFVGTGTPGYGAVWISETVFSQTAAPYNATQWTMEVDLIPIGRGYFVFEVKKSDNSASRFVNIQYDPTGTFPTGGQWAYGTSGLSDRVAISIAQGVMWRLKWDYKSADYDRFKVWRLSDPEPSSWLLDSGPGSNVLAGPLDFVVTNLNTDTASNANATIQVASITFEPCPEAVPVTPVGGFGCENVRRTSSTVYQTTSVYVPESTFVWVGGLLQYRGTDYTEDADGRTLTFASPVDGGASVRACYVGEVRTG